MRATGRPWLIVLCVGGLSACGPRGGTTTGGAETERIVDGETAAAPDTTAGTDDDAQPPSLPPTPDDVGPGAAPDGGPCRPLPLPSGEATDVNWGRDDSTACPEGAGTADVLLPDGAGPDLESCAAVQQVRPAADPTGIGRDRFATVVLAGDGPEIARSFLVAVPPGTALPFAEGDVLSVRIHEQTIRIHRVVHATLADAAGRLLVAVSGGGDPAWAPGWRVRELEVATTQPAPNSGGAERREHLVGLSTAGHVARVPPYQCRQLEADGAVWRLNAHAIRYGEGSRLPDSSEYMQYSLLRADRP